jgi:hypothetical protein
MKTTTDKNRMIAWIFSDYTSIENDADLRKRHLTLSDYNIVYDGNGCLAKHKPFTTFVSSVAEYFKRNGFSVNMDENGINYIIDF